MYLFINTVRQVARPKFISQYSQGNNNLSDSRKGVTKHKCQPFLFCVCILSGHLICVPGNCYVMNLSEVTKLTSCALKRFDNCFWSLHMAFSRFALKCK
jgi:hypothetical protein